MSVQRPNILLILTDQQRWDSLGCYGASWVPTPNLDRLAADGVRFDAAYCNSTICTPSRASLWTGRAVPEHGVSMLDDVLPAEETLVPWYAREAGWETALFGKLHVSGRIEEAERRHPRDGFEHYEWSIETSLHMDSPFNGFARWLRTQDAAFADRLERDGRGVTHIPHRYHFTHWAAERTIRFLRERDRGRPFFTTMSVFDPHNPYDGYPPEFGRMVDADAIPPPVKDTATARPAAVEQERRWSYLGDIREFSDADVREMRHGYHAAVALIDLEVGRVLDVLEQEGLAEETLVIFTSDHGDMLGDLDLLVKGAYFYDPGVRVPLVARFPGRIPSGSVVETAVQPSDIAHTVAHLVGATIDSACPGEDLVELANGGRSMRDDEAICTYRNAGLNRRTRVWDPPLVGSMIRHGRHKLTTYSSPRREGELFDLVHDPHEVASLWDAADAAAVRSDLLLRLDAWHTAIEDRALGSRGGRALPRPDQLVVNTIEKQQGGPL